MGQLLTFTTQLVKKEKYNKRDLRYNNWHRTLSRECIMFDFDCFEINPKTKMPCLAAELKHWKDTVDNYFQLECLLNIINNLKDPIPFFKIKYYPSKDSGPDMVSGLAEPNEEWLFELIPINDCARKDVKQFNLIGKIDALTFENYLLAIRGLPTKKTNRDILHAYADDYGGNVIAPEAMFLDFKQWIKENKLTKDLNMKTLVEDFKSIYKERFTI